MIEPAFVEAGDCEETAMFVVIGPALVQGCPTLCPGCANKLDFARRRLTRVVCVGLEAGTWTPLQKANLRKAAIKGWSRVMAMHQHLLLLALDPGS